MSKTSILADSYLMDMADDALVAAIGRRPTSRASALEDLSSHVYRETGMAPTDDALARAFDTALAFCVISVPEPADA